MPGQRPGSPHPKFRRRQHVPDSPASTNSNSNSNSNSKTTTPAQSPIPGPQDTVNHDVPPLDGQQMMYSIVVPAKFDYTQPRPKPANAALVTAQLDQRLAYIDENAREVKRNIAALVLREAARTEESCLRHEAALAAADLPLPASRRSGPTAADEDHLMRCLTAPQDVAVRSATSEVPASFRITNFEQVNGIDAESVAPDATPRDEALTRMLNLVRYGALQMSGYERHVEGTKSKAREQFAGELGRKYAQAHASAPSSSGGAGRGGDAMDIG